MGMIARARLLREAMKHGGRELASVAACALNETRTEGHGQSPGLHCELCRGRAAVLENWLCGECWALLKADVSRPASTGSGRQMQPILDRLEAARVDIRDAYYAIVDLE